MRIGLVLLLSQSMQIKAYNIFMKLTGGFPLLQEVAVEALRDIL